MRRVHLRGGPSSAKPLIAASALLVTATLLVYAPLTRSAFINYDDPEYILDNAHVLRGLDAEGVRWAFGSLQTGNWHPLTWLSHMLDVSLFGLNPGAHHAVSLLLHAANTVLLLLVLAGATGSVWPSALAAALFAIHPQHVQSVAWVAERKDVLSTFFGLLALGAYVRQVRAPGPGRTALTLALYALSLMSKPMLVTLPLLLLLLDYWPLGRLAGRSGRPWTALLLEKLPFFLLAAASSVVTFVAQKRAQAVRPLALMSAGERAANALHACGMYLYRTFLPLELSVHYPLRSPPLAAVLGSAAALAAVLAAAWVLRRRLPFLAVGWCWYLVALAPVIGLVQVGTHARADRYTYLPLVGIFLVLAWGLAVPGRSRRFVATAVALAALVPLGIAARQEVGHWSDTFTLFKRAYEVDPENPLALKYYGIGLMAGGRYGEGSALVKRAQALDAAEAHLRTALALESRGRTVEAAAAYRKVLDLNPSERRASARLERLIARGSP